MTPLHFISHFLLLFVCCQLCISTPTPPSSSFPSASDLWGSSATPVDVAGIDCAIRELAVSFAQSLTYTAAAPVFDALQIASLCNTTSKPDRPHDDILPYPTRRMQIHQAIGERPYPQLRKETHLSDRALKTNDQLAAARRRVEEYKYVVADSFIYFVDAATGSDSNPGTQGAPFKTILRAVQTLRYARAGITPSTSSYIFLRATATHYLASTLVLTPEDSYTIIAGWDSAAAIVSGGAPIINPTWTSQGGGVYSTQLPSSINVASDAFNVLYVNGRRAICARFPNANPEIQGLYTSPTGWMDSALSWSPRTMGKDLVEIHIAQPNRTGTQFPFFQTGLNGPADVFNPKVNFWATADPPAGGQFYTPGGLVYNATLFSPNVPNWKNAQNGIISAFHGGMWGQWAFTQLTVDSSSNSIQWAYGGFQEARGSNNGANWFVSNILAELDSAFEFYVDPATRTLYYYPNQTYPLSASFVASQLITLISVTGDADAPVTNVGLTNLQLTHSATSWLKPYEAPSGGDVSVYRGGGVFLEGTEQVEISYVQFNAISSNAICVSNYNRYAFIHDNEFIWTGDSAIVTLGSTRLMDGNSVASYPKYTTIQSNLIHELGVYTKQVAAVLSSISGYHTIRENVMFNMPRAGICLNDGFMGGHLIERNLIFNTVRETGDHGPINSWDRQPYIFQTDDGTAPGLTPAQSQSHNNFLINTYNSVWTIDHDDGSAYHYDSENVLVYGGWKCYLGHSIQAVNNVYVLPDARPGVTPGPGGWGAFCAQQFAPTPGVSGWGNEWAQNICMLGYSGIVYDQQNCNESNLKDVEPWTFNNQFYGPVAVNITCGNNAYTLPAWTKLTGFDSGSVEKGIPTVSIVQQLVKAMLAM